jgi:hypothetical protein
MTGAVAMNPIDLSASIYENGDPLEYPSRLHGNAVLVTGGTSQDIFPAEDFGVFVNADGKDVDAILASRGASHISARVAQLAFGAHRNIQNLAWKFANYNRHNPVPISQDFVIVPAWLRNADVVACNISSGGHVYSGLLTTKPELGIRKYLLGNHCPVGLLLLDEAQMRAMHQMGGVHQADEAPSGIICDIADAEVDLGAGLRCRVQMYDVNLPYLSLDGTPIAFSTVGTLGRSGYRSLDQAQMFTRINTELRIEEPTTGRIPIADTLNDERRRFIQTGGVNEAKKIRTNEVFLRVTKEIAASHTLADEDGKRRVGFEDVYVKRAPKDRWSFAPLFKPARSLRGQPNG